MINLLKYTYTLQVKKIDAELNKYWQRYQKILKKPSWEKLNEARAILYLISGIYCEQIVPEAIERRLHLLKSHLSLMDFFLAVDRNSKKLTELRKDNLFLRLEEFYRSVKNFKNKVTGGKYYLDEEKFTKLYNQYNPEKNLKMGYQGQFKIKKKK
jgi:hypothetical protein